MNSSAQSLIVCGTDFSEPAQRVADVAARMAQRLGTNLLLVHGIDERGEFPHNVWRRLEDEDRPRLAAEAARLRALGYAIEERLVGAVPDDGVAHCAEKAQARMILVASSGLGAAGRWIMGSVSERIAESARVPTLVVRDPAPLAAWLRDERALRLFVAADFSPVSEAALRWARDFSAIAPCAVTVGHVDRTGEVPETLTNQLRAQAHALFGPHDFQMQALGDSDRVDLRLLELAENASADVIIVGAHQWHGLDRLRHPSVSRRILHEAKVNVACVPAVAAD